MGEPSRAEYLDSRRSTYLLLFVFASRGLEWLCMAMLAVSVYAATMVAVFSTGAIPELHDVCFYLGLYLGLLSTRYLLEAQADNQFDFNMCTYGRYHVVSKDHMG